MNAVEIMIDVGIIVLVIAVGFTIAEALDWMRQRRSVTKRDEHTSGQRTACTSTNGTMSTATRPKVAEV